MTAERRCAACSELVPEDAAFCPWCGHPTAAAAEEPTRFSPTPEPRRGGSSWTRLAQSRGPQPAAPASPPGGERRRHALLAAVAGACLAAAAVLVVIARRPPASSVPSAETAPSEASRPLPPAPPPGAPHAGAADPHATPRLERQLSAARERLVSGGDPVRSLRELGALRLALGQPDQAATWLEAAAAAGREAPPEVRAELLCDAAVAHAVAGRHDVALALVEQALVADPGYAPARAHRGTLRVHEGRLSSGLDDIDAALATGVAADRAAVHATRAQALLGLARIPEALAAAERALALDPGAPAALQAAASASWAAGDAARARDLARRALEAAPGRPEPAALIRSIDASSPAAH